MPLRQLIAVVAAALGAGFGAGALLSADGEGRAAAPGQAALPGKLEPAKPVKVPGLAPARRIPALVEAKTRSGTTTPTATQPTTTQPTTTQPTVTQPAPPPPPRPPVDPDPSE